MNDETKSSLTPFSDFLKQKRAERGEGQVAFAKWLEVSPASIGQWERSEGYPRVTALPVLCDKLEMEIKQLHELIENQRTLQKGGGNNVGGVTSAERNASIHSGGIVSLPELAVFLRRQQDNIERAISEASEIESEYETHTIFAPQLEDDKHSPKSKEALDQIRQDSLQYEDMAIRRAIELNALGKPKVEFDLKSPDLPPYKYDYLSPHLTALFLFAYRPDQFRLAISMTARRSAWKLALSQAVSEFEVRFHSACLFIIVRGGEKSYPEAAAEIRRLRAESKMLNVRIRILDSTEEVANEIVAIEKQHIIEEHKFYDQMEFNDHDELLDDSDDDPLQE